MHVAKGHGQYGVITDCGEETIAGCEVPKRNDTVHLIMSHQGYRCEDRGGGYVHEVRYCLVE